MENRPRLRSLSRAKDFLQLKTNGITFHVNSWLLVNMQKNELKQLRCAWSISKQVGPATTRNRFKRWAREYCRKWLANDPQSLDMNLIFKRRDKAFYQAVSHEDFDGAMDILVQKMRRYIK